MRVSGPSTLKCRPDENCDAIVLAFNQKWNDPLLAGKIKVVFRKQGPHCFTPSLMYAYITAPISAIIARMPIISHTSMPTEKAILLATRGDIDVEELRHYAKDLDNLLVTEIGQIAVAKRPITLSYMSANFNFWPSSSFIPLSASGARTLDKLGQFENIKA